MLKQRTSSAAAATTAVPTISIGKSTSSSPQSRTKALVLALLLVFALLTIFAKLYIVDKLEMENQALLNQVSELAQLVQASKATPSSFKDEENLREQLKHVERKLHKLKSQSEETEDQVKYDRKQAERMRRRLHEYSLELCLQEPTLRVLMQTAEGDITFDIAPCELTPVVSMFIVNKVKQGFWRGMTFFRAESHVIQATRKFANGTYPEFDKYRDSIPFQEYSPDFPHKIYTLGLAGRPGGTDFYVNMQDNVRNHGPGGQSRSYKGDDPKSSDACFGKIVSGEEVARRIQSLPFNREGGMHILQRPVEIIDMSFVM